MLKLSLGAFVFLELNITELINLAIHRKIFVFVLYEGCHPYTSDKIVYITKNPTEFFEALRSYMVLMVEAIEKKATLDFKIGTALMSVKEIRETVSRNKEALQRKQKQSTAPVNLDSVEPKKPHLTLVPPLED